MTKRVYLVEDIETRGFFSKMGAPKFQKILNEKAQQGWIFDKVIGKDIIPNEDGQFLIVFYKENQ